MANNDFTAISHRYEGAAVVQKAAAEVLLALLQIGPQEDVLDLGCGTGHLTKRLAELTAGRVVGVDPAPGMIAQAQSKYGSERIVFEVASAEDLQAQAEYDVIFCNSALQWWRDPERAREACRRALRPGGRIGFQAPARHDYCPNFLKGMAAVASHPETGAVFAHFRSPWFFRETAEAYASFFSAGGFNVPFAKMEVARTRYLPEKVIEVFESGAAAGYLNAACYDVPLPSDYFESCRRILADSFQAQAEEDGQVTLVFHRIYLMAERAD